MSEPIIRQHRIKPEEVARCLQETVGSMSELPTDSLPKLRSYREAEVARWWRETEKLLRTECKHCGALVPPTQTCSCQTDDRSIVRAGSIPLGMPQSPEGGIIRFGGKTYKLVECDESCDAGDCDCESSIRQRAERAAGVAAMRNLDHLIICDWSKPADKHIPGRCCP